MHHKLWKIILPVFLIIFLTVSMVNASTTGLISRWSFEEGTGILAGDSVGTNSGTLTGPPSWDSASKPPLNGNQYSLRFDGYDYVVIPDDTSLDLDFVTLSAWVLIDPTNSAVQANIVRKGTTGSGNDRVYGLTIRSSGQVRGFAVLNSSLVVDADNGTALSKSAWHHIAMSYDGQQTKVYIDGVLDHTSGTTAGVIADNDKDVMIGGIAATSGWYFKGNIDEVRIYNRALTTNEIASLADTTSPVLDLPADLTIEATSPAGATVTYSVTAADAVDGSLPVNCEPASGSVFPVGTTQVNCSVTDANGNTALGSFDVTVVDTTLPALYLPADLTVNAIGPNNVIVNFTATALDLADDQVEVICTPASGSVFPVGTTTVICQATDNSGNSVSGSFTVTVNSSFANFLSPIDMGGTVNVAKAGSTIPVKFSLGGDRGLDIILIGYPISWEVDNFASLTPHDVIEQTITAGNSTLTYNPLTQQYTYAWKTSKGWSGMCRQLYVQFADGSSAPLVNFEFR